MTKKRRNCGRSKNGRGRVTRVRCESSGAMVPKDKAIKRQKIINLGEGLRDLEDTFKVQRYLLPKLHLTLYYCVSAAIRIRAVRVRPRKLRRLRIEERKDSKMSALSEAKIKVTAVKRSR